MDSTKSMGDGTTLELITASENFQFYEKLEKSIWHIEVSKLDHENLSVRRGMKCLGIESSNSEEDDLENAGECENYNKQMGTGVCISNSGIILTAYHVIKDYIDIHCYRESESKIYELEVLAEKESWDLAALRVKLPETEVIDFEHAEFAEHDRVEALQSVYAISNQLDLHNCFHSGHTAYPCKASEWVPFVPSLNSTYFVSENNLTENPSHRILGNCMPSCEIFTFHPKVPIIQMNNMHIMSGGSGCPIFTSTGRIIGIYVLGGIWSGIAVHVSAVRKFCNSFMRL